MLHVSNVLIVAFFLLLLLNNIQNIFYGTFLCKTGAQPMDRCREDTTITCQQLAAKLKRIVYLVIANSLYCVNYKCIYIFMKTRNVTEPSVQFSDNYFNAIIIVVQVCY